MNALEQLLRLEAPEPRTAEYKIKRLSDWEIERFVEWLDD